NITLTDKRAADVLNALAALGNSANTPLQWAVWPDGDSSGALQLLLEARPTTPAYFVHISDFQGVIGFDGANFGNRQRIRPSGGSAPGAFWRLAACRPAGRRACSASTGT